MTLDAAPGYLSAEDCRLADLIDLVSQKTDPADYPYASAVEQNVLIYDGARLRMELSRPACRPRVEAELVRACTTAPASWCWLARSTTRGSSTGPRASSRRSSPPSGRRAARPETTSPLPGRTTGSGTRWRNWPCARLRCSRPTTPTTSSRPCAGPGWGPATRSPPRSTWLTRAARRRPCTATITWGSPPHERAARFPAHVHRLSPVLTLQGAVAHTDMPAETGPTMYLPHSQKYLPGYLAWRQPEFREYFEAHHVQLPLRQG